jgi:hypothetical protein
VLPRKDVTPFERQNKTGKFFRSISRESAIGFEHNFAIVEVEIEKKKKICGVDGVRTDLPGLDREARSNCSNFFGGADGVVPRRSKKTEEKPLNTSVYCHLLIFLMSLRNP